MTLALQDHALQIQVVKAKENNLVILTKAKAQVKSSSSQAADPNHLFSSFLSTKSSKLWFFFVVYVYVKPFKKVNWSYNKDWCKKKWRREWLNMVD